MITIRKISGMVVELVADPSATILEISKGLREMDEHLSGKQPKTCSFKTKEDGSFFFKQIYGE